MNLIFLLFTGIAIGVSGAMIPGTLTLFTVSSTLQSNKFAGLKIVLGHVFLELIFIAAIFLGLQSLLNAKDFLFLVSVIGGVALIIMGVILILTASRMRISDIKTNSGFNKGLFIGGAFFSLISPGFLVWWSTIGISTVTKALLLGITGLVFLTLGHWIADIAWYWSLSYAVDKGKMYLSDKVYQNIIRFISILLIILGIHFLLVR